MLWIRPSFYGLNIKFDPYVEIAAGEPSIDLSLVTYRCCRYIIYPVLQTIQGSKNNGANYM